MICVELFYKIKINIRDSVNFYLFFIFYILKIKVLKHIEIFNKNIGNKTRSMPPPFSCFLMSTCLFKDWL